MRIGELLVEQRKLSTSDLTRALADKPIDTRLCSFLITRGLIEFDEGSRALGEQKRVACALSKHLAHRDPDLANLIPRELGRGWCALPIGRTSKGSIIVCVRDPSAAVMAALAQAIPGDIMMVIAPADRLERLVADAYGKAPTGELDIELDFPTVRPVPRRALTTPPMPLPIVSTPPPMPDMDALDPASVRDALIDLDDERVVKDFSHNAPVQKPATLPTKPNTLPPTTQPSKPSPLPPASTLPATQTTPPKAALPPATQTTPPKAALPPATQTTPPKATLPPATQTTPPRATLPPDSTPIAKTRLVKRAGSEPSLDARPTRAGTEPGIDARVASEPSPDTRPTRPMSLQLMSVGLDHAPNREAATDLVLAYVATRWECALVLAVRDKAAIGYRGHAVTAPEAVTVSLGSPSTVQRAFETRDVSVEAPSGVGQSVLAHALNNAKTPAAAPVIVAGRPVAIIAVGDPIAGVPDRAADDLKMLADALGAAYERIHAR